MRPNGLCLRQKLVTTQLSRFEHITMVLQLLQREMSIASGKSTKYSLSFCRFQLKNMFVWILEESGKIKAVPDR